MSDDIERFYMKFAKDAIKFNYDEDGNLVERDKAGTVIKTITLSAYRPLTLEEIAEMERARREEISLASQALDDARVILYNKMQEPDPLPSVILKLNEDVLQADLGLQHARFKHKDIDVQEGIRICDLDFTQLNEVRKYPDPVSFLRTSPFSIYEKYVRPTDPGKRALISVAEAKAEAKAQSKLLGKQNVILFGLPTTNEYGFLSMRWPITLRISGIMYKSAAQAIHAEYHSQNPIDHAKIMASEDGNVAYSFDDISKRPESSAITKEGYWSKLDEYMKYVNIAKFKQYPELALRLLQTGDAVLGAWETYDNDHIGIGIDMNSPTAKNPATWTGENVVGKILMEIRALLKKGKELKTPVTMKAEKAKTKKTAVEDEEKKEVQTTKVINLSDPSVYSGTLQQWMENPKNVYIGKKGVVRIDGKRFPEMHSRWVNPFDGFSDNPLKDYEDRIKAQIDAKKISIDDLLALKGKTLGCYGPVDTCHGQVLLKLIDKYSKELSRKKTTKSSQQVTAAEAAPMVAPVAAVAPAMSKASNAAAAPVKTVTFEP